MHSHDEGVETKLRRIAEKASRESPFSVHQSVHLMNEELLLGCFERLRDIVDGLKILYGLQLEFDLHANF